MGTILIIDDDVDLVESYRLAITKRGHDVRAAHSAAQARELLQAFRPDAVVLDVMMETMDSGFELARQAHEQYPGLRMLILTSVHGATPAAMHFEPDETWLPVAKFLDKPVDPAALADEIESLLDQ